MTCETPDTLSRPPHNTGDMTVPDDDITSINMPLNVNESDNNDLLSNIDPDIILKGLHTASILTPHLLNQILKMTRKCQYFIPTLEALLKI